MSDTYQTDSAGKMLVCSERVFVPAGADRQCVRPLNHAGPHAFPVDAVHVAHQKELARVDVLVADLRSELAEARTLAGLQARTIAEQDAWIAQLRECGIGSLRFLDSGDEEARMQAKALRAVLAGAGK